MHLSEREVSFPLFFDENADTPQAPDEGVQEARWEVDAAGSRCRCASRGNACDAPDRADHHKPAVVCDPRHSYE